MNRTLLAFILAMCIGGVARAAVRSGPDYETDMKASMLLMSFDRLAEQCDAKGGFGGGDGAAVDAWKAANGVNAMRARAQALQADPVSGKDLGTAVGFLMQRAAQSGMDPCAAAVKIVGTPEAQFATLIPGLTGSGAAKGVPSPGRPALMKGGASLKPSIAPKAGKAPPLAAQIDSFGFATRVGMGMGGFITTEIYPVVLFRDGAALTDVTGLSDPSGAVANRTKNPSDWTRWRRSGGKVELMKGGAWEALPFPRTYAGLPPGFRLNALYRRLSGGGNMGAGGDQSVTAIREYRFWADGSVLRGGSAGAAASAGTSSVVTRSASPDQRGQYRIDGLTLTIAYDNGSSERRILVADPSDPKTAIWLDGDGYVQRRR
jgi:hypothetical protein